MTDPPRSLLEVAAAAQARLLLRGREFSAAEDPDGTWHYRDGRGELAGLPRPALEGVVQAGNAATALAALRQLGERLPLDRRAIEQGLRSVQLAGRFQRIAAPDGIEWVLDVAHNPAAAATLAANLARRPARGRTFAVCGLLDDKDAAGVLACLGDRIERWFAASTDGARGLADTQLALRARAVGIEMVAAGTVPEAMQQARGQARPGDRIVVFGSFHTVGPALACV